MSRRIRSARRNPGATLAGAWGNPPSREKMARAIWAAKHPDYRSDPGRRPGVMSYEPGEGTVIIYLDTADHRTLERLYAEIRGVSENPLGRRNPSKDERGDWVREYARRDDIAEDANRALRGSRYARHIPHLEASSDRATLIRWLTNVDANGVWSDEDMVAEGWEPMTLDQAWEQVEHMIQDEEENPASENPPSGWSHYYTAEFYAVRGLDAKIGIVVDPNGAWAELSFMAKGTAPVAGGGKVKRNPDRTKAIDALLPRLEALGVGASMASFGKAADRGWEQTPTFTAVRKAYTRGGNYRFDFIVSATPESGWLSKATFGRSLKLVRTKFRGK